MRLFGCFSAAMGNEVRHAFRAGAAAAPKEDTVGECDRLTRLGAERPAVETGLLRFVEQGIQSLITRRVGTALDAHHHSGREHRRGALFELLFNLRFHFMFLS